jgi:hypothetical protein
MQAILTTLQSTNSNIEKLIYLILAQNKQQQLLILMQKKQNESTNNRSDLAETELNSELKTFINAQQNFTAILNILYNSYHHSENDVIEFNNSNHDLGNEVNNIFNSDDKLCEELNNGNNSFHS